MFLKRLELQGFKSFAGKTVLDFESGVTAIVGPNGSGKSNIVDAIRWLLGEREVKNLRGSRADDLIFAGTSKRPRAGLCQTSIYFDNTTGVFPIEFEEVVISRRISRDGQSVFLLNQNEIRLKDIIDFFVKAKLGARGLNVINQGESDNFLKMTSLERREKIEEILGLKEYILKKNTALRELKNTIFNLEKTRTILEELSPRLRILQRQVGRYRKREIIESELKALEEGYFGHKIMVLQEETQKFEPILEKKNEALSHLKIELEKLKDNLKKIEKSEPCSRQELESIRHKKRELFEQQLAEKKDVISQKDHQPTPTLFSLIIEIKKLAEKAIQVDAIEEIRFFLKKALILINDLERVGQVKEPVKIVATTASLDKFRHKLDELEQIESSLTKELEEFNKVFREALREIEFKKEEIQILEDSKGKILFEKQRVSFCWDELKKELEVFGKKIEDFSNLKIQKNIDEENYKKRIQRLRVELAAIGDIDEALIKEAKETEERFEFLKSQIDDLTKASTDLKELIKELDYKVNYEFSSALSNINKELKDLVKLMFGGGRVVLKLESTKKPIDNIEINNDNQSDSPNSVLAQAESLEERRLGIEIEVNLFRKNVSGLDVLSGGERSLLAVIILFALMSISPPPFIILDEIDAALDERNTRRFGELLKKFSAKTQFIVVTHNRTTMEAADVLYGVTMAGDGVSKVVSLKLID